MIRKIFNSNGEDSEFCFHLRTNWKHDFQISMFQLENILRSQPPETASAKKVAAEEEARNAQA